MPNIILKNDDKIITIQHTSAPYIVKSNDYNDLLNKPDLSVYATKIDVDDSLAGKAEKVHVHTISDVTGLQSALDSKSDTTHNHDDRYYTESETDAKLATKANTSSLAPVATSGDYTDLTNKPTIPVITGKADITYVDSQDASVASTAQSNLTAHTSNTSNPHSVTKAQVGLGNVENTSDANKPISTATQTALNGKVTGTGRLFIQSTAPASPINGDLWMDLS